MPPTNIIVNIEKNIDFCVLILYPTKVLIISKSSGGSLLDFLSRGWCHLQIGIL